MSYRLYIGHPGKLIRAYDHELRQNIGHKLRLIPRRDFFLMTTNQIIQPRVNPFKRLICNTIELNNTLSKSLIEIYILFIITFLM